ncbi:MAG: VanZ family protein [Propionibacteriaceae bacterium]|nr:VanZ family protein [Propionibacteriaceae bacterium]
MAGILAQRVGIWNIVYLAGNLVGFLPLGFFLPALFSRQRKFPVLLITVMLAVATLELAQVTTMRGSLDIDDIILNTTGAAIGFRMTRTLHREVSR